MALGMAIDITIAKKEFLKIFMEIGVKPRLKLIVIISVGFVCVQIMENAVRTNCIVTKHFLENVLDV